MPADSVPTQPWEPTPYDPKAVTQLRRDLREDLGPEAFERQPWRALLAVPGLAVALTGTWALVTAELSWWAIAGLVVVVANAWAMLGFLAHEALHGAVVKDGPLRYALGTIGFAPYLVSPTLWITWHNQVHHGNTNVGNLDPDAFGTTERYERAPSTRFVTQLAPGSGRKRSALFLFYWFTFHAQVVLWLISRFHRGFKNMNRRRAVAETIVFAAAWVAFAVWAGPRGAVLGGLLPMSLANFIVMSYIATNHFLRPQSEGYDPVTTGMSVRTLPIVDRIHLNFSYHVEHHLFPSMSPRYAPDLHDALEARVGQQYVRPPHWLAIRALYQTPRVYLDAHTLVDPYSDHRVEIPEITKVLTEV